MAKSKRPDPKVAALRQEGSLNPHPESVSDPLFASSDFFDGRDLIQVKYEMVRRVRADGHAVSHAAAAFGFSRPSFYQAQAALGREGLPGLLPKKRGPRGPHKLGDEVMDFLGAQLAQEPSLGSAELARRVGRQFGLQVHPRSIERALARQEKKRP
ncbi:MAG: helix-turn-helix domain containing protein [Chloroflexi bacterium]|nr:helix-turn-helix domain containing protein [Chloroflexota bacterium]